MGSNKSHTKLVLIYYFLVKQHLNEREREREREREKVKRTQKIYKNMYYKTGSYTHIYRS